MSTIRIADKPTLDNIDSNVSNVLSRGGIKFDNNSTKPQVYNTSNNTWTPIDIGGGGGSGGPTLVVINDSGTMDNKDITVVSDNGLYSQTKPMESSNYIIFELPWLGTYYIKYQGPGGLHQQTAVVQTVGGVTSTAVIPRITVINGNRTMDNRNFRVESQDGTEIYNCTMPADISIDVPVNGLGTYGVYWCKDLSGVESVNSVVVDSATGASTTLTFSNSYPSFSSATYDQIASMLTLHYNDEIDLSTIWAVGDTKSVSLSSMSSISGANDTHVAQTQEFVILDFNHDNLYSSINGHTKAAISLQLKDCLKETGLISASVTTWPNTTRYSWCDSIFKQSLPYALRNLVKRIYKKYYSPAASTAYSTACYVWLASYSEITDINNYEKDTQYEYYKTTSNRIKKVNGTNNNWWTRTYPYSSYNYYCAVFSNGGIGNENLNYSLGLCPGICL